MRLVVFDLDGTLIDSAGLIAEALGQAFEASGRRAPPRRDALSVVGLSLPEAIAKLAPDLDALGLERLTADCAHALAGARGRPPAAFAGAAEMLAKLDADPKTLVGVATGASRRGMTAMLEGAGLSGLFDTLQCADDHPSKPHPAMLREAMAVTGVPAGRTTMVGDTTYDILMAVDSGARALGAGWGHHGRDVLMAAGAEAVAADFAALERLLAQDAPA